MALSRAAGLLLLLLLASAAPAAAAINLVTSASATGTNIGANPYTVAVNLTTGGNNTVVVVVAIKNTSAGPTTVEDSGGSVYLLRADLTVGTSARIRLYSTAPGASKNSTWVRQNVNCCTGTDIVIAVASYSGVVALGPVTTTSVTLSTVSISQAISDANNLIVAGFAAAGPSDFTASGQTQRRASAVATGIIGGALSDNTSPTAGASVTNTLTLGGSETTAVAALELRAVPAVSLVSPGGFNTFVATANLCNVVGKLSGVRPGDTVVYVIAYNPGSSANVNRVLDAGSAALSSVYTLQRAQTSPGSNVRVEIWSATVVSTANPASSVSGYFTTQPGNVKGACAAAAYSGVSSIGNTVIANGTAANPSISLTTQDPSNYVVAGFASQGTVAPSAFTGGGNFRQGAASSQGGASTNAGVALNDNASPAATSVTNQVTLGSGIQWAAAAIELRSPKWIWSSETSAANMAPPALDPWSNLVIQGSNDAKLYVMADADGTPSFQPFVPLTTGGAIQARPTAIPAGYGTPAVNIAYVSSQDGYLYAVYTTGAQANTQAWKGCVDPPTCTTPLGTTLQGGAAVWLQKLKPLTFTGGVTTDVVFVGTNNGTDHTGNKVYALRADTGAIVWTFAPVSPGMDIISSMPYVDYGDPVAGTPPAVWVTSRSNQGSQPSVWKLNAADGTPIFNWTNALLGESDASLAAGIDSAPPPSADGKFVYVGTNAGNLKAIRVSNNAVISYTCTVAPCGTGAINGLPWPLSYNAVGVATPDTIIFSRTTTVHSVNFDGTSFSYVGGTNWNNDLGVNVSAPVDDGANHLYIGGNDGKVHQLCVATGADQGQVIVAAGTPTVAQPTFNVDLNRIHVGATDGRIYSFSVPLVAVPCP